MGMFEYVMVLVSIIVALAMTQLLGGFSRIITSPTPVRLSPIHLGWCLWLFLFLSFFWWWEYGLRRVEHWRFEIYLLVLGYATLLYFLSVLLMPNELPPDGDLERAFMARRRWFFGIALAAQSIDVLDTMVKGGAYFADLGLDYLALICVYFTLYLTGFFAKDRRVHLVLVTVQFSYLVFFSFELYRAAR